MLKKKDSLKLSRVEKYDKDNLSLMILAGCFMTLINKTDNSVITASFKNSHKCLKMFRILKNMMEQGVDESRVRHSLFHASTVPWKMNGIVLVIPKENGEEIEIEQKTKI